MSLFRQRLQEALRQMARRGALVLGVAAGSIYAGAYAFGRTGSRVSVVDGSKRIRRGVHRPMAEWDVLIKDHHAAVLRKKRQQGLHAIDQRERGKARQEQGDAYAAVGGGTAPGPGNVIQVNMQ